MYFIDPNSLVQATVVSQPRATKSGRRNRNLLRRNTATSPKTVQTPRQHPRLWALVPFHHAYS